MCFKKFCSSGIIYYSCCCLTSSVRINFKNATQSKVKKIRVIFGDLQRDDYQIIQISRLTKSHADIDFIRFFLIIFLDGSLYRFLCVVSFNSVRFKTYFFFIVISILIFCYRFFILFFWICCFLISAYAFCIVINQVAMHVCIEDGERWSTKI